MKKILKIILGLLITLIVIPIGKVNAASYSDVILENSQWVSGEYISKKKGNSINYQQMTVLKRKSDMSYVYCIQPGTHIITGNVYTGYDSDYIAVSKMSEADWNRISLLAYYGYGYKDSNYNHTNIKWYVITQYMIWRTVPQGYDIYFTDTLNGNRITKYTKEMEEIESLIANHYKRPNFSNNKIDMVISDNVTLKDTNNVLNYFSVSDTSGGVSVTKSGNELNIKATDVGSATIKLKRNYNRFGHVPIVYADPKSQDILYAGDVDPIEATLNINVIGGKVTIHKIDANTNTQNPQGEATLKGAKYGIYKEDGTLISEVITDEYGNITSDYLPFLGNYFLKELSPSKGYTLDSTSYNFSITEDNLYPVVNVYEKVIEREIEITKVYASDKTGELIPEKGVKFGFYNNTGELVKEVVTNEDGRINVVLPYGKYTVKQLTTSPNYEYADDLTIEVIENGKKITKTIANAEITAKLNVVKIDSETNKVIKRAGIKFKIFSIDKNDYVCQTITYPKKQTICEWETNDNGEFVTAYPLSLGKYRLEEVDQKIDGYLWNSKSLEFEIDENSNLVDDSELGIIFKTKFENKPVKGQIIINKLGEEFDSQNGKIEYINKPLEGVKFNLYASEDIIDVDGSIIYKKGDLVSSKTSDEFGKVIFDNLHLAKYYICEVDTLNDYILNAEKIEISLEYKDQYTEKVIEEIEVINKLKKGELVFNKIDSITGKYIPNTKIAIYTADDILVFEGVTDESGKIKLNNIPINKIFYLIETEASKGYVLSDEKIYFEVKENEEQEEINMKNKPITGILEFTKIDFSTSEPIPNTLIEIYTDKDELVYSGRTNEEGQIIINDLVYGKYYIIEKETASSEYILNTEKMYFEILEDGEIVKSTMTNEKVIVEVPDTNANNYYIYEIISGLCILLGIGIIIYGVKKNKI